MDSSPLSFVQIHSTAGLWKFTQTVLLMIILWVPESGVGTILVQSYLVKLLVLVVHYAKCPCRRGWALTNALALCQVFAFDLNKRVDTTFVFSVRLFQEASLMAYLNYQQRIRKRSNEMTSSQ